MSLKSVGIGVLAIPVSIALVACGGDDGGGGRASAESREEAGLEFAECMREHGIDVPDPQPGERTLRFGGPASGGGGPDTDTFPPDDPAFREAMQACQDELGELGPRSISPQDRQEAQEAALRFAQCMRDHGVNMPDPQFSDGPGGGFLIQQGEGTVDPDSPAFREAAEACQDELPDRPGAPSG
jgi:hypothetical protein